MTQRGSNRQRVLYSPTDYKMYLSLIGEQLADAGRFAGRTVPEGSGTRHRGGIGVELREGDRAECHFHNVEQGVTSGRPSRYLSLQESIFQRNWRRWNFEKAAARMMKGTELSESVGKLWYALTLTVSFEPKDEGVVVPASTALN